MLKEGVVLARFLLLLLVHTNLCPPTLSRVLESLLRKLGLLQKLSHLWMSAQVNALSMFPDLSQERLRLPCMGLLVSQLIPRYVCLLPKAQVDENPLESFGVWYWIPQLPQRHFCFWMAAKF